MIYLKFLAVILANVGACAHTFRTFARTVTVIRCLIWLSLYGGCRVTDFSVNLPATQVHIKARSSCITADRMSKRNAFFSPSHSSHFLASFPSSFLLCSSYLSFLPIFLFSSCILPHATPYCSRVYPVFRTHGEMYVQKPHIKININTCVTTSYNTVM